MVKAGGAGRGITRDQVVSAAFEVLDDDGLDSLTMRRVADRLGVRAAALYWHVASKADLLDEMGTSLWRAMSPDLYAAPDDLTAGLTRAARSIRATLLAHRDGAAVFAGTRLLDPALLQAQEAPLAAQVAAGRSLAEVIETWQIVLHFTVGWTAEEQGVRQAREADPHSYDLAERDVRIEAASHPLVAETGRLLFGDPDAAFERLLARLVAGLAGPGAP